MRRGYLLLAALWVLAIASILALGVMLSAREAIAGSRNRLAMARAQWTAEGCLAAARARIDSALREVPSWGSLDRVDLRHGLGPCDVRLRPSGAALDVNAADATQLGRTLRAAGRDRTTADSMTQALLDWRDADDTPRPLGAERDWYRREHRLPPRNAPLASVVELSLVRGFPPSVSLHDFLDVEHGRLSVMHASAAALASLPGLTAEAVEIILARRARGDTLGQLAEIAAWLPGAARDSFSSAFSRLVGLATLQPDAWLLEASAAEPAGPRVSVELRLVWAGDRAAIVRRKDW